MNQRLTAGFSRVSVAASGLMCCAGISWNAPLPTFPLACAPRVTLMVGVPKRVMPVSPACQCPSFGTIVDGNFLMMYHRINTMSAHAATPSTCPPFAVAHTAATKATSLCCPCSCRDGTEMRVTPQRGCFVAAHRWRGCFLRPLVQYVCMASVTTIACTNTTCTAPMNPTRTTVLFAGDEKGQMRLGARRGSEMRCSASLAR